MTDLVSSSDARGVVSCVVDADLRFHLEALRWYAGLNRIAGVESTILLYMPSAPIRHLNSTTFVRRV